MKRKILIVTHKLGKNYGGLMQAYALQKVIEEKVGIKPSVGHFDNLFINKIKSRSYFIMKTLVRGVRVPKAAPQGMSVPGLAYDKLNDFIANYIDYVKLVTPAGIINRTKLSRYDTVVVGSDQVWRRKYVNIPAYLLQHVDKDVYKVAYAASFGRDDMDEYSPRLIKKSRLLAARFDAISVREHSGVLLCRGYWGVEAIQLVDPTLLLDKDDYNNIVENSSDELVEPEGDLFVYVLDRADYKATVVEKVAEIHSLTPFEMVSSPPATQSMVSYKSGQNQMPSPEQWLKNFRDAKFIVTDSFHGCVFSIIFNKPFIAIGNKNRGLARFTSLLKIFKLENRLVLSAGDLDGKLVKSDIDWSEVNAISRTERERSFRFLKENVELVSEAEQ